MWDKVTIGDDCWEWTGAKCSSGYGSVWMEGKCKSAHRAVYEWLVGPIPAGLVIDHLCRNRACVHPKHMELVTPLENHRRGIHGVLKTLECKHGHPYTPENTRVNRKGSPVCRVCTRSRRPNQTGRTYKRRTTAASFGLGG